VTACHRPIVTNTKGAVKRIGSKKPSLVSERWLLLQRQRAA
jgi:hypothetical protein